MVDGVCRAWITVYVKVWIAGMDRFVEPVYDPYWVARSFWLATRC